jgi:hypothetical protein
MGIEQWVSIGSNIIVGLSAFFAALFAFLALRAWRDETRGRDKYTVARNTLVLVLKLRDELANLRSPIFTLPTNRESDSPLREYYADGFRKVYSVLSELEIAALEVEAVLDSSILDELKKYGEKGERTWDRDKAIT